MSQYIDGVAATTIVRSVCSTDTMICERRCMPECSESDGGESYTPKLTARSLKRTRLNLDSLPPTGSSSSTCAATTPKRRLAPQVRRLELGCVCVCVCV
jgi:hypothetical protein